MSYRFDKYRDCTHAWNIEEAGKNCKLCGAIVYNINTRWIE